MRDDQEFNINFVGLVEAHPCLYDNTREDYHMNHVQERAWTKIVQNIGEGATNAECKSRWKNLRGSYTKHLKKYKSFGSGASVKRPYYLAEYMCFILPFTKSRQSKTNVKAPTNNETCNTLDGEILTEELEIKDVNITNQKERDYESSQRNRNDSDEERSITEKVDQNVLKESDSLTSKNGKQKRELSASLSEHNPKRSKTIHKQVTLDDVNKSAFASMNNDADAQFLMSLLPDLKNMTDKQKRRFKVGILNLAVQILDEDVVSHSSLPHYFTKSENFSPIIANSIPSSHSSTACSTHTSPRIEEAD